MVIMSTTRTNTETLLKSLAFNVIFADERLMRLKVFVCRWTCNSTTSEFHYEAGTGIMDNNIPHSHNDDGNQMNPNFVPKPSICISCIKDELKTEEILKRWLRSLGANARVLSPNTLADKMAPKINAMLKLCIGKAK